MVDKFFENSLKMLAVLFIGGSKISVKHILKFCLNPSKIFSNMPEDFFVRIYHLRYLSSEKVLRSTRVSTSSFLFELIVFVYFYRFVATTLSQFVGNCRKFETCVRRSADSLLVHAIGSESFLYHFLFSSQKT